MKVAYIGNFEPEHSTENHVRQALLYNDHEVFCHQENNLDEWNKICNSAGQFDLILWTRTGWQPPVPKDLQLLMIDHARKNNTPVVGYHLDRWFGLNREGDVSNEPFFKADLNITADGGHQAEFEARGVNHVWFPPGVSLTECMREPADRPEFRNEIVFVGSSKHYHKEWSYRIQLVDWLQNTFGHRFHVYPKDNQPALRGQPLVDLYNNCKVIVGDSCLNGGITHYWSDRIPETLGRRGFLIHPNVEGLNDHFTPGEHLATYDIGDFNGLRELIEYFVTADEHREEIKEQGQQHVLRNHTYEVRMKQLVELLTDRGML